MNETSASNGKNTLTLTTSEGAVESEFLTNAETVALAQFVKRVGWFEFTSNAGSEDEAYLVKEVFDKLQEILARSGYIEQ